ncbi:MAG: MFS transporter [Planctomycetes bacterium]|nr:MFS transporter [Planctomycetota bacterium]
MKAGDSRAWRNAIADTAPEIGSADEEVLDSRTWKRTLTVSWIAQFASITGFSFAIPFLPDYLEQLGINNKEQLYIWSGLVTAAPSWMMFIFAPLWGLVADRVGRKAMVMRSMYGGFILLALMGTVSSPAMLLVLRLFQGALTGTVTASNALVSSVTPAKRASFSIGLMQTAVFAGAMVGPLVGGVMADGLGYGWTFLVAGIFLLAGGILVTIYVDEGPVNSEEGAEGDKVQKGLLEVIRSPGFMLIVTVMFVSTFSRAVLGPIFLPFVKTLLEDKSIVKTVTGSLFATTAAVTAAVAVPAGRLADRYGPKVFLVIGTIMAGLFCIPQAFVPGIGSLYALRVAIGIGMGMVGPAFGGLINRTFHRSSHGKAFGLIQSASSLGMGLAPVTGGLLAAGLGLEMPFVITGCFQVFVGFAVWAAFSMSERRNGAVPTGA